MNRIDFIGTITSKLIEKLNEGTLPWRKSWKVGLPSNFITKNPYNGINFISLLLNEYPSPYYLTFLQCKEKGGMINKGEKGYPVVYWKIMNNDILDAKTNELKSSKIPFIRYSYVFNLYQTTLYSESTAPLIQECESIINNMKPKPIIKHNSVRCYYSPQEDYISLPRIEDFESREEYYSSLFHELIHWTGHPSRLNRAADKSDKDVYAYEELIAEIGSAYLCSLCGISNTIIDNQASYIQGWIKILKKDSKVLMDIGKEVNRAIEIINCSFYT